VCFADRCVGCNDITQSIGPAASRSPDRVPVTDAQSFYYYQGQKIFLTEDPSRIVVSTSLKTGAAIRGAIAAQGVTIDSAAALQAVPGHWLVQLPAQSHAAAAVTRAMIRKDLRFDFVSPAFKTVQGNDDVIPVNRVAVQFKPGVTQQQIESLNAALGTWIMRPPRPDSGFTEYWLGYPRDPAADPLQIAASLATNALVEWADPDKISNRRLAYAPTDPFYSYQWHLKNTVNTLNGVAVDDNIEPAWALTLGSRAIHVAVIDDGIDWSQPDILGAWSGAMTYDLFYGNGYPDDATHPFGNDTHGTSIAGIIGADQNNGNGVAGIAPGITFNLVRMFRHSYPLFPGESFTTQVATDAQIADGIYWAASPAVHSDVINNSWGGGSVSNAVTTAIINVAANGRNGLGTVVVFAAGNPSARSLGIIGPVSYPATLSTPTSSIIAVSAIDRAGAVADYSPDGSAITLVAPSGHYTGYCVGEVVTTDRPGAAGCNDGPQGNIDYTSSFSGTSAAAPQVSAIAALLLSREPGLTAAQVKSRLVAGARPWGASTTFGAGKVDAYRTLVPPAPLSVAISGPTSLRGCVGGTWTATPSNGTAPYSYTWSAEGGQYNTGSNPQFTYTNEGSAPSMFITVTVTDANNTSANKTLKVNLSLPGSC
jgi:subtilisin family serine protease